VAEVYVPSYTNLFTTSGAQLNKRINSSGALTNADGYVTTDFIDITGKTPFSASTKLYVKNANFNSSSNYAKILSFVSKPASGYACFSSINSGNISQVNEGNGVISVSNIASSFPSGVKYMVFTLKVKDSAITADDIKDIVITIDEPIV
jgi:hypothetical protein